jgi:hypothetical protein
LNDIFRIESDLIAPPPTATTTSHKLPITTESQSQINDLNLNPSLFGNTLTKNDQQKQEEEEEEDDDD